MSWDGIALHTINMYIQISNVQGWLCTSYYQHVHSDFECPGMALHFILSICTFRFRMSWDGIALHTINMYIQISNVLGWHCTSYYQYVHPDFMCPGMALHFILSICTFRFRMSRDGIALHTFNMYIQIWNVQGWHCTSYYQYVHPDFMCPGMALHFILSICTFRFGMSRDDIFLHTINMYIQISNVLGWHCTSYYQYVHSNFECSGMSLHFILSICTSRFHVSRDGIALHTFNMYIQIWNVQGWHFSSYYQYVHPDFECLGMALHFILSICTSRFRMSWDGIALHTINMYIQISNDLIALPSHFSSKHFTIPFPHARAKKSPENTHSPSCIWINVVTPLFDF